MSDSMSFTDALEACIENFGPAPRKFSLMDRMSYLRLPKPIWLLLDPTDKLWTLFKHARTTWEEGVVVWGHIVQVNNLMFEKGTDNCPGEFVYSLEDADQVDPAYLANLASSLYGIKGVKLNRPELAKIADYLADEYVRVFGLPVPHVITEGTRCRISSSFFVRKHLPGGRISTPLFPIIVNPKKPHVVLPLPERYWPKELIDWWGD